MFAKTYGATDVADPPRERLGYREAVLFIGLSTLVVAVERVGFHLVPKDFLTYRYAARDAFDGRDIYAGTISGPDLAGQPFTYTPFAALIFRAFGVLGRQLSYFIWTAASLTGLGLLIHALRPARSGRAFLLACATTVVFTNVAAGQVNIFLMGLCLLDLGSRGRLKGFTGVGVGLAAAIKLTPALFIVYLAITRQWKPLRTSLLTGALATGLGYLVFPQLSKEFFGHALWNLQERVRLDHALGYWGNASLSGALQAVGGGTAPFIPLAVLAITVAALAGARIAYLHGHPLNAVLIVGLAAPMASPFAWGHHYIYLIPALMVLVRSLPEVGSVEALYRVRAVGLIWLLLVLGPGTGHWLLHRGIEWLLPLGLIVREGPLLAGCLCIVLLVRSSTQAKVAVEERV